MAVLARSIIQESPIIQDSDIIDYTLDATGDTLKYSSSPYTLKNLYKLLFSIPKIIGEKNRRKGAGKFNGIDILLTGTITSSGVTVTGSGTLFTSELAIGDWICGSANEFREVSSIVSDTSLVLSNAFTVDILAGQNISRLQYFTERMDRIERLYKVIGEPFPMFSDITGSVIPDSNYFIELSKDLTGAGLYNENKLTGQSSVDTNEQRYYTAIINDSDSPMYLQTVKLVNSVSDISSGSEVLAPAFLGASNISGSFMANQIQNHYHEAWRVSSALGGGVSSFSPTGDATVGTQTKNFGGEIRAPLTDGVNGTPRVGKFTIPNTVTAKYYMRIK